MSRSGDLWQLLGRVLTPLRVAALGVLSLFATGLVIGNALSPSSSPSLLAAIALRARTATSPAQTFAPAVTQPDVITPPAIPQPTPTPTPAASLPPAAAAPAVASAGAPAASSSPLSTGANRNHTTAQRTHSGTAAPTSHSRVKHVFLIVLSSPGYQQAFGAGSAAPFLSTQLRPQGTLLSGYTTLGSGELADLLGIVSGQPPNPDTAAGCPTYAEFPAGTKPDAKGEVAGAGCIYPIDTLTIADQLESARQSWHAYVEDVDAAQTGRTCTRPPVGGSDPTAAPGFTSGYATRHNPFVYFHSLLDLGDCTSNDVGLGQLLPTLAAPTNAPNLNVIVPNLCHYGTVNPCPDGTPGGLPQADAFLKQVIPGLEGSPLYRKDGMIVVAFTGPTAAPAGQPQPVGALLLSPFVKAGATDAAAYDPYSLLRSLEDVFALRHLASAAQPSVKSFAHDISSPSPRQ